MEKWEKREKGEEMKFGFGEVGEVEKWEKREKGEEMKLGCGRLTMKGPEGKRDVGK